MSPSVQRAAAYLADARTLAVSSGAGMSAESGVATFRDDDGLWSRFNPSELATPDAFRRNPLKVWEWYRQRRQALARVEPHDGHRVLAKWEARFAGLTLITQNVDGLHHRAGSRNVIELHGRLDVTRCTQCGFSAQSLEDLGPDPACSQCAARVRPGVIWFGESLPAGAFEAAIAAAESCDAFLVIGTSGLVQPAASLAEIAKSGGARVIEINPNETPLSALADVCIRSGCRDALLALDHVLKSETHPTSMSTQES
jgi:NAD-dependent deacetylase